MVCCVELVSIWLMLHDLHETCIIVYMSTLRDWIPSTSDFAARLVLVRHEMGWNLKEAALACGVKPQSWREWELENRKPRDYEGVCRQIAESSGCNLGWLMMGAGEAPHPSRAPRAGRRGEAESGHDEDERVSSQPVG